MLITSKSAAGFEQSDIALWLGHERLETTDLCIHADLAIKERALALGRLRRTSSESFGSMPARRFLST